MSDHPLSPVLRVTSQIRTMNHFLAIFGRDRQLKLSNAHSLTDSFVFEDSSPFWGEWDMLYHWGLPGSPECRVPSPVTSCGCSMRSVNGVADLCVWCRYSCTAAQPVQPQTISGSNFQDLHIRICIRKISDGRTRTVYFRKT